MNDNEKRLLKHLKKANTTIAALEAKNEEDGRRYQMQLGRSNAVVAAARELRATALMGPPATDEVDELVQRYLAARGLLFEAIDRLDAGDDHDHS